MLDIYSTLRFMESVIDMKLGRRVRKDRNKIVLFIYLLSLEQHKEGEKVKTAITIVWTLE